MPSRACETATATQAFLYLPIAETRSIAAAYSRQQSFNAVQLRAEEEWFTLAGFGDPKDVSGPDLKEALQKVTIAYAYLISVQDIERRLIGDYDQALKLIGY